MESLGQLLSVVLVLGLLAGGIWLLNRKGLITRKWRGQGSHGARLRAVERIPLTAQHTLHLVRLGDRALLLAAHTGGCTLVESRPWHEVETAPPHAAAAAR